MQNDYLIAVEVADKLIGLYFGLGEYNSSVLRVVALNESQHSLVSLILFHHKCVMLYCHRRPGGLLLYHVYGCTVFEVSFGESGYPRRNSC